MGQRSEVTEYEWQEFRQEEGNDEADGSPSEELTLWVRRVIWGQTPTRLSLRVEFTQNSLMGTARVHVEPEVILRIGIFLTFPFLPAPSKRACCSLLCRVFHSCSFEEDSVHLTGYLLTNMRCVFNKIQILPPPKILTRKSPQKLCWSVLELRTQSTLRLWLKPF